MDQRPFGSHRRRIIGSSCEAIVFTTPFFAAAYHSSGSPLAHMQAKVDGLTAPEHGAHDVFHYDEGKVKRAVKKRMQTLRGKHGNLPSQMEET